MIRVGFGYDVHRLVEGRDLWLGGVKIAHDRGLDGHSDADVLIHAICDAMLGAANMRDIGYHFPDTSEATKDMDSKIILRDTVAHLAEKGYHLGNIDATVCAERPKLSLISTPCATALPPSLAAIRLYLHQGDDHRASRLYRPQGGHLGLCRLLDREITHAHAFKHCNKYKV